MKATSASSKKDVKAKAAALLSGGARRIEYVPIQDLISAARNPKRHADADIDKSVGRFGFTEPILMDERTGRLVAGHGRVASLFRLRDKGEQPPEGVILQAGAWAVPVVRGWASRSDQEADAYLLASNQLVSAGGWNEEGLVQMLRELEAAQALDGIGFSEADLKALLKLTDAGSEDPYTSKVDSPVYKPTGAMPSIGVLCDPKRTHELVAEIDATEGLTDSEKAFLRAAAQRHLCFDYQNIAEFYAHASAPMQRQMEKSALVIIDFKQAIELGFVKLAEAIAADMETTNEDPAP